MITEEALRRRIRKQLRDAGTYEIVDETLIEELVYNTILANQAKADIARRGIMVDMSTKEDREYITTNPSVNVYNTALKQITSIAQRLGISPAERRKLGLEKKKVEKNELDNI